MVDSKSNSGTTSTQHLRSRLLAKDVQLKKDILLSGVASSDSDLLRTRPSGQESSKRKTSQSLPLGVTKEYEFGGPIGALSIMIFSHIVVYYLWITVSLYGGELQYPTSFSDVTPFLNRMFAHVAEHARPSLWALKVYGGFIVAQCLMAVWVPGFHVKGMPVASLGGKSLDYLCNAIQCLYITLATVAVLHATNIFNLASILDHHGELLTIAVIFGDLLAVYVFVEAYLTNKVERPSGNHLYDFFMGINLNPRIKTLDIKLFCEVRLSWMLLFLLTLGAACKQYEQYGTIDMSSMGVMVLAHLIYANSCAKGEQMIPPTFDITYERFGWMLSFWNLCGVPFSYCFQSVYLSQHPPLNHPWWYSLVLYSVLLFAYWVWDTANAQKSTFRQIMRGTYKPRKTFPQLPWSTLKNPRYLKTECGSLLLVDGWYRYARKIHYTADIVMALIWGMSCGFDHFLPYFYFCFFVGMILHRYFRDVHKMKNKYGKDWDRYVETVPYVFIPFVI